VEGRGHRNGDRAQLRPRQLSVRDEPANQHKICTESMNECST
jgi:hypothetical protein